MIIAHLSDSHISLPEPENSHRLDDLRHVVKAINAIDPLPDIAIHTGDIAHNGKLDEYQAAYELLQELKMPLYVIPGNKDERTNMRSMFNKELAKGAQNEFFQYTLDLGTHRFLMLDTLDEGERLGKLCEQRFAQMEELLAQDKTTPTYIFMHHPPFEVPQAPRPFQFDKKETVNQLEEIVRDNCQVKEFICGHSHRYGDYQVAGIRARSIPSLAIDLRFGEYPEEIKNTPIFEVYSF